MDNAAKPVFIKTTQDGRKIEVIGTSICIDGAPEADTLVPVIQHPNFRAIAQAAPGATHMAGRLALTVDEAEKAWQAMQANRAAYEMSTAGIAERTRRAVNDMLLKRSDE